MLQAIRDSWTQWKSARAKTRDELVAKLMAQDKSGKPITAENIDEAIALGVSVDELETMHTTVAARVDAAADLDRAKALQADYDRLSMAYTQAAELRDAMVKRHAAELAEANGKLNEAFGERRSIGDQARQLRDRATRTLVNTSDPAIGQAIAALQAERQRLRTEANESMQRSKFIVSAAWDRKTIEARRVEHDRKNTEWLAGIAQREAEIVTRISELEAKRLDPAAVAIG